jgi:LPS export ABC transporter protein LptC
LAIVILFVGCSGSTEEVSDPTKSAHADRVMFNADIDFVEEGNPSGRLKADSLLFFDDEKRTFGYNIDVDFFDKDGNFAGKLFADSGWIENQTQQITVYGEVFLSTEDGVKLWTDSLAYFPKTRRVMTSSGVRIDKNGEFISGQGLDSDLDFTDIKITENVTGRLKQD